MGNTTNEPETNEPETNEPHFDLCIYHGGCQDGFTAAWVVHDYFVMAGKPAGFAIKFVPGLYDKSPPDVTDKDVIIVDFSYKAPVMREMVAKAKSITVLDHHGTAETNLKPLFDEGLIKGVFDNTKAGCILTWEFFHPTDLDPPWLLRYVQDRDLWKFKYKETKAITAYLFSYDFAFDWWTDFIYICDEKGEEFHRMLVSGEAINRKFDRDVRSAIRSTKRTMVVGGMLVPAANLHSTFASEAANIMAENAPFAVTYFDTANGNRRFELRSSENGSHVGKIAESYSNKTYNGGGHEHAAGFYRQIGWSGDMTVKAYLKLGDEYDDDGFLKKK